MDEAGLTEWDPSQVKIWGSNWVSIPMPSDNAWTLITDRPTLLGDAPAASSTVQFSNEVAFLHYFIQFTETKGFLLFPAVTIAEVRLVSSLPMPGDPVIASSTNSPLDEGVQYATDDDTTTRYLNKDGAGSGLFLTLPSAVAANDQTMVGCPSTIHSAR